MGLQVKDCPRVYLRTPQSYDTICDYVHHFRRISHRKRFTNERLLNEKPSTIFLPPTC